MKKQHPSFIDDEQEEVYLDDFEESETSSVNHSGKSAIYTVAYFALLAVLMYPAQKLHLGTQGVFFAMIVAGLVLALGVLAVKWVRDKMASMQISKKGFMQLMVGYAPDDSPSAAEPEPHASMPTTTPLPRATPTDTSLVRHAEER